MLLALQYTGIEAVYDFSKSLGRPAKHPRAAAAWHQKETLKKDGVGYIDHTLYPGPRHGGAWHGMAPSFECPVLLSTFTDPVVLFPSGNTFELGAVVSWYRALQAEFPRPLSDPCTRQPCMPRVVPNWLVRKQMHECGLGDSLVQRSPGDELRMDLEKPDGYTVDNAKNDTTPDDPNASWLLPSMTTFLPGSMRASNFITIYRMHGPSEQGAAEHVRGILEGMLPALEVGMVDARPLQYMAARAE